MWHSMNKKIKQLIEIVGIIVAIILVALIIYFLLVTKPASEKELKGYLNDMGKDFYTTFYYKQISNGKSDEEIQNYLSKFKDIGIKVSLTGLSEYNAGGNDAIIEKFKNESNEECNRTNTKVIIYPKEPYTKTDYVLETVLDCNFEKNKK